MNCSNRIKPGFILTVMLAILLVLAACSSVSDDSTETGIPVETLAASKAVPLDGYTIIRSDLSTSAVTDASLALRSGIRDTCGLELIIGTDWIERGKEIPADTAEILVGSTNRREAEGMRRADWSIEREGKRVYILAGSDEALRTAVDFLSGTLSGTVSCSFRMNFRPAIPPISRWMQ